MPDRLKPSRFIPVSTAAALLVSCSTLFFVFTCPWLSSTLCALVPLYDAVLFLFVMANFTMATFMDAGVFPQASEDEDKEEDFRAPLYKNVEVKGIQVRMKWCSSCHFYRPPRCSHCSVCDNCVEDFDHHCPWVNNCIGRRNYRFFFLFLISLSVHITSVFSLSLLYVLHHQESLTSLHSSITMIVMCVAGLFFIPVLGLTGFHVVLVARGRTTNEQVTGKFQGGVNPFTHGCYGNVKHVLCSPLAPRYLMDVSKRPVVLVSPPFRRPAHSSCSVIVKVNDNGVHSNILTTKAKSSEDRDAQPPLPPKAERHPHHRPHHQIHTQLSSSEESTVSSKATAPPTPAMYKVQAVFGTMPKEQTCATGGQIPDECQSPVQEERCHDYRSEPNLDVPDYGGVDTPLHRHFLSSPYQLDSFGVKFVTRPGTVQPDTLTSTPNRGVFSPGTMSSRNGSLSYDSLLAPVPPPQPFHSPHLPMKTCHTRRPDAPRQAFHQSPYSPVHAGFMYARERDPSPVRYDNLSQTIMASIQERKDLEEREKLIRRQGHAHTYVCPNDSGMFDGHFAGCRGSRAELSRVGVMAYGSRAHHASASELIRAHATSTSSLHSEGGGHVHSPSHQPPLSPASSPCSPSLSHQKLSYVIAVERVGSPHLSARKDVTLRPADGHSNTRDRALLSPSATPLGHTHHTSIKKVMGVGGTTYEISV